jgi:hypothetical protein
MDLSFLRFPAVISVFFGSFAGFSGISWTMPYVLFFVATELLMWILFIKIAFYDFSIFIVQWYSVVFEVM